MSARRIQRILIVVLLLAGSLVLLAEYFGFRQGPSQAQIAAPRPSFTVVQARREIARGAVIEPADITVAQTEIEPAPGTLTRLSDATDRVTTTAVNLAEPISDGNSAPADEMRLANLVPPGLRAVALRVSEETAVANLVRPGDRVDVLVASNPARPVDGRAFGNAEARTVLQNILVLAVGAATVASDESPEAVRNVTLAVTPREAAMVALIRSVGTEYLSLRANGDDLEPGISAVSTNDLQGAPLTAVAPAGRQAAAPRPAGRTVEVITGAGTNRQRVAVGGGQ
jgi:pilus assembly protein CpaB